MFLRIILFIILGYLIIRLIRQFMDGDKPGGKGYNQKEQGSKKVSKDVGEYIDYEEVDD